MCALLASPTELKVISGVLLLSYWFAEKYRQDNCEAKIKTYERGVAVLRFIDVERTLIQTLSYPTSYVGTLVNKVQSLMNHHLSECETLADIYGLSEKNKAMIQRVRKRTESYLYKYGVSLVRKKGGPGATLIAAEQAALDARYRRCVKFVRASYQRVIQEIDLERYDTAVRFEKLERENTRFYWATSLLFILGSAMAWFS